jgi:hypothetical protein
MVDMKSRVSAANLIKEFAAGRLTNDEFDEQYPDSEDRGAQTIGQVLWLSWDDRFTHRLEVEYQHTDQQKALFYRCIAFLQTELEYTGPSPGGSVLDAAKGAWKRLVGKEQRVVVQGSLESAPIESGVSKPSSRSADPIRSAGPKKRNSSIAPISDSYAQYLDKNAETAHQLSSIISSLLEYQRSMAEIEKLRSMLVASGWPTP